MKVVIVGGGSVGRFIAEQLLGSGHDVTVLEAEPAIVKRHTKQSPQSEGGIISKEATIDLSNIAIADPKDGKATRVGFKVLDDGRKVRFAKRSGDLIDG